MHNWVAPHQQSQRTWLRWPVPPRQTRSSHKTTPTHNFSELAAMTRIALRYFHQPAKLQTNRSSLTNSIIIYNYTPAPSPPMFWKLLLDCCHHQFIIIITVHRWRSGLSCCCCLYLQPSATTRHIRTFYVCFPRSSEGFSLRAFFPMTFTATFVVPAQWQWSFLDTLIVRFYFFLLSLSPPLPLITTQTLPRVSER